MEPEIRENKRKKGSNYTTAEKEALITIVKEYIGIIENKFTNAENIKKKQNAWMQVALKYNAVATSGLRTWVQLRHTYANIKQITKKNVAIENKQQYYQKELRKKAAEDKKNIIKTGGGGFRPVLSEMDNQVLALVAPQITPLKNQYDDAAAYFDDIDTSDFAAVYCDTEVTVEGNVNLVDLENLKLTETPYHQVFIEEEDIENKQEIKRITDDTEENSQPNQSKPTCTKRKGTKKLANANKAMENSTKENYFKIKLGNAKLERKILLQRYRNDSVKDKLEIQLLKSKIKKYTLKKNIQ